MELLGKVGLFQDSHLTCRELPEPYRELRGPVFVLRQRVLPTATVMPLIREKPCSQVTFSMVFPVLVS